MLWYYETRGNNVMGNITMIASGKGGVGKSTTTACLGLQLAEVNKRVLLIDMDSGLASLEHMLGIRKNLVYDISDIVNGNCTVMKAIYKCEFNDNLFLLPAPRDLKNDLKQDVFHKLVDMLSKYYDHILIDCPAGIGNGFLSAIGCSDNALLVATPNPISVANVRKARDILVENGVEELRLVINRFDRRLFQKSHVYDDLDQVIDTSGMQLIAIGPEDREAALLLSNGTLPSEKSHMLRAIKRLSGRLNGERIPLPSLRKL